MHVQDRIGRNCLKGSGGGGLWLKVHVLDRYTCKAFHLHVHIYIYLFMNWAAILKNMCGHEPDRGTSSFCMRVKLVSMRRCRIRTSLVLPAHWRLID